MKSSTIKSATKFRTFLREPLLHFLVIGAAIFFVFSQIGNPYSDTSNRIIITQVDLDKLAGTWLKRMGRPPTEEEREQQLKHYIREQILYREAINIGLDKDDVIIRRRLAKKMQYLFDDLSFIAEPTDAELNDYLAKHADKFTRSATISFQQIYLAANKHQQTINEDATQLRDRLNKLPVATTARNFGDSSLLPYQLNHESENAISAIFGATFSENIFALAATKTNKGKWQGPIDSEYGTHLLNIISHSESRLHPLAEVHERVKSAWRNDKRLAANEIFYQSLSQRYQIILDDDITININTSSAQ